MKQWEEVERRADACNKTTTSFIRDKAVSSEVRVLDLKGLDPFDKRYEDYFQQHQPDSSKGK